MRTSSILVNRVAKTKNKVAALTEYGFNSYTRGALGYDQPAAIYQPEYFPETLKLLLGEGMNYAYMVKWRMVDTDGHRWYPYLISPTRAFYRDGNSSISRFINGFLNDPRLISAGGHGFYELDIAIDDNQN